MTYTATAADFDLGDDGTLDTLVYGPGGWIGRYSDTSDYREKDSGRLDWDRFVVDVVLPDWESE